MTERKAEVEAFKQQLEQASDVSAKRALIQAYRDQAEQKRARQDAARPSLSAETMETRLAKMKAQAGTDPTALARVQALEKRTQEVARLKEKLAQIDAAEIEDRQELLEEFRAQRMQLAKERELEAKADLQRMSREHAAELPPAMLAVRAKAEARQQEIEELKAALDQAQPSDRAVLIEAFREKQKAAREQHLLEMKNDQPQPQKGAAQ